GGESAGGERRGEAERQGDGVQTHAKSPVEVTMFPRARLARRLVPRTKHQSGGDSSRMPMRQAASGGGFATGKVAFLARVSPANVWRTGLSAFPAPGRLRLSGSMAKLYFHYSTMNAGK